jgi:hypothetical protein
LVLYSPDASQTRESGSSGRFFRLLLGPLFLHVLHRLLLDFFLFVFAFTHQPISLQHVDLTGNPESVTLEAVCRQRPNSASAPVDDRHRSFSQPTEVIMPQAPGKASSTDLAISAPMRRLIFLYLSASVAAIAVLLFGGAPSSGIFLVLFALPWSLFVSQLTGLLGFESATLNLALLAVGVGINAAMLYLLGRWLRRRASSSRPT